MADPNDYQLGDTDNNIFRKILNRLTQFIGGGSPTVTLTASDLEIGAVEIKNSTDDTRAIVTTAAPGGADPGLVVRIAGGGSGDGAIVDGVSSAIRATVFDLTNSNPIATQLVDANGDPVSASGGTQYSEDTPATAGEQLNMAGVVRRDSRSSLVDADGDRTELQVNSSGDLRVDGSAVTQPISAASLPLPTGAATEASLASLNAKVTVVNTGAVTISTALPAGNNNIGDVDVASMPAPLSTTGGGTEAASLRVTVANDSTGVLSVDDNGSSLTVDTPQLPAALVSGRLDVNIGASSATVPISAASLPLPTGAAQEHTTAASPHSTRLSDGAAFYDATKTGQLPTALVGGRLDVVVGAALPAGTNNIGDVDVLTLPAIPAGNNNIGDVDANLLDSIADNGPFTDGTSKVLMAGYVFDETAGTALTENDAAAARLDSKRAQVLVIEDETTRGRRTTVTAANALKVDGSAVTQPVSVAATLNVNVKPATTGGFTTFHLVSAATTNATNVKASAGQLFGWYVYNSNASARKVVFHNTSGTPTAGASVFFSIVIPALSGANVFTETGIAFGTGIGITTVTGLADSDSAAVAANDLIINLFYA